MPPDGDPPRRSRPRRGRGPLSASVGPAPNRGPLERYQDAIAFLDLAEQRVIQGRRWRDEALAELSDEFGPAQTHYVTGFSLSHIRSVRQRRDDADPAAGEREERDGGALNGAT